MTFDSTRDCFFFSVDFFTFLTVLIDLLFTLIVISSRKRLKNRFETEEVKELKSCKRSLKKILIYLNAIDTFDDVIDSFEKYTIKSSIDKEEKQHNERYHTIEIKMYENKKVRKV